jgi:hypothetical protein
MNSVKLRMSILKSQLKKYRETCNGHYSYYQLDKQDFDNYNDAREHAVKLYNSEFEKMNAVKRELNNNKYIMTIE